METTPHVPTSMNGENLSIARLVSDSPAREPDFDFRRLSKVLASLLAESPPQDPFTVCIRGGWGVGKTTMLSSIQSHLPENFAKIWFEPWKLSDEVEVRNVLVWRVLQLIEQDAGFLANARVNLDGRNVVRLLIQRLSGIDPDQASKSMRAESRARDSWLEVEEIFDSVTRQYLVGQDNESQRRLVIFVDDLDRCRPDRVVEVLETAKLFFSIPGVVFVFGVDDLHLRRAIERSYEFSEEESRIYLEKMFQMTFDIPQKSPVDTTTFLAAQLEALGAPLSEEELLRAIASRFGRNLRQLKVFLNNYTLHRELFASAQSHAETPAIDAATLTKWLYLEATMPEVVAFTIEEDLLELFLAMEFLGYGGLLADATRQAAYLSRITKPELDLLQVVAAHAIGEDAIEILGSREQRVARALEGTHDLMSTLQVLGSTKSQFIDADIRSLALRIRSSGGNRQVAVMPAETMDRNQATKAARQWDTIGDSRAKDQRYLESLVAYLVAHVLAPDDPQYLSDINRALRYLGQLDGSRAVLRRVVEEHPEWAHGYVELAYTQDLYLRDLEGANLCYRLGHQLGSTLSSTTGNFANNLHRLQAGEQSVLDARLATYLRADGAEAHSDALQTALKNAGYDIEVSDREALEKLYLHRSQQPDYALRALTPQERNAVTELVSTYPTMAAAADALRLPAATVR